MTRRHSRAVRPTLVSRFYLLRLQRILCYAIHNVERYTISNEAWMLGGEPEAVNPEWERLKKEGLMIADSPLKKEVLMCTAVSRFDKMTQISMIKEDRTLEKKNGDHSKVEGRFTELLPPKGLSDATIEATKVFLKLMTEVFKYDIEEF